MAQDPRHAQFQTWLLERMVETDHTPMSLAAALGILDGTIEDWVAGRSAPTLDQCQQLAQLFEIPVRRVRLAAGFRP